MEFRHVLSSCAQYTVNQVADDFLANVHKPGTNIPHKFSKFIQRGLLLALLFYTQFIAFLLMKEKNLTGGNVHLF